jgi:hypothetical protein
MRKNSVAVFIAGVTVLTGTLSACAPSALNTRPQFIPIVPIGRFENKKPSSVGGYAEITPFTDGKSRVSVKLGNLPPETVRAGSIVYGNCDKYTNTALTKLEPIRADRDGVGASLTVVDTDKLSTTVNTKASLAILYYQRGETDSNGIGDPITCGDFIYRPGDSTVSPR